MLLVNVIHADVPYMAHPRLQRPVCSTDAGSAATDQKIYLIAICDFVHFTESLSYFILSQFLLTVP